MPDPPGDKRQPEMTGREMYEDRWWFARLRGITLRAWDELPVSIRRVWDERAARKRTTSPPVMPNISTGEEGSENA